MPYQSPKPVWECLRRTRCSSDLLRSIRRRCGRFGARYSRHTVLGWSIACLFQPVLALRFHKGRESVQVLVCFMCDELVFERKERPVEWQDKLKFSKETRTRLLAVAKALPEIGDWARVK